MALTRVGTVIYVVGSLGAAFGLLCAAILGIGGISGSRFPAEAVLLAVVSVAAPFAGERMSQNAASGLARAAALIVGCGPAVTLFGCAALIFRSAATHA